MKVLGNVALTLGGVVAIVAVFDSAIRTFMLPRGASAPLTRIVFSTVRSFFNLLARETRTYEQRDRAMALYAPFSLLALVLVWVVVVMGSYLCFYRVLSVDSWRAAFRLSGSSILTLGSSVRPVTSRLICWSSAKPRWVWRSWPCSSRISLRSTARSHTERYWWRDWRSAAAVHRRGLRS